MIEIVKLKFGSHLYGTNTENSDLDLKAVHIPNLNDLLLQRAKLSITRKTKQDNNAKNTSEDIDFESFALHQYLKLLSENQTVALDMIFAPENMILSGSEIWNKIRDNKHLFFSKKYASFLGYCKTQSNRFGIKGSRISAVEEAIKVFNSLSVEYHLLPLSHKWEEIKFNLSNTEHILFETKINKFGVSEEFITICNRMIPKGSNFKFALQILNAIRVSYGERAKQAQNNQNVDWKALSHAVRIGHQSIEFLKTSNVIFPRPDAQYLLDIKLGRIHYKDVAEEIETLIGSLESASAESSLPDKADSQKLEEFILEIYREALLKQA